MENKEILSFEAETKQILDLMIHSIYTHKEIFLRELISNASDALDKAYFESITKADKYKDTNDLKIRIKIDKEKRTITISDNGIGMTKEEVKQNIGSIAKSGTKAFIEKMKSEKNNTSGIDLIGQFGVGFYSSFMIASKVVVETRSVESEKGVRFESNGDGTYSIEEIERGIDKRGTDIILTLKEDMQKDNESTDENYLDEYTIQGLVEKYSNYVRYPIVMSMPKIEEGKEGFEDKVLNSMKSIWQKNKNEVKSEEYDEFYKSHFHDFEKPFEIIHTKAEGTIEYTALLFLPSKQPMNFFMPDSGEFGLQLYCKNVFIMDKCKEILPEYLKFVRGLVDSQDFSLNISREILQHTGELKKISSNLEKKILDTLSTIMKNERDRYESFWVEFGEAIKLGVYNNTSSKEKLSSLLLFKSSQAENKYTTLSEYKSKMKEGQKYIYFATGKDIPSIERLPHMEGVREKGYEVLYFTDRVDEFVANILKEFEGVELKSILQKLDDTNSQTDDKENKEEKTTEPKIKEVLNAIKNILGEKIHDVEESSVLKESAVCFVSRKDGPTINMARILTESGQNVFGLKAMRILEINTKHKIFEKMIKEYELNPSSDTFKEYSELLFDQACILESLPLEDSLLFAKRMSSLMTK